MTSTAVERSAASSGALTGRKMAAVLVGVVLLALLTIASMFIGSGDFTVAETWAALTSAGDGPPGPTELIVREFRVPRTILAIVVGIALGLSGAIIQALTRNPLADPGILGVNVGAYTAVVCAAAFLGSAITIGHVWIALAGALLAALIVYGIGNTGRAGGTPTKLVLTGVAFGAVLNGISFAITCRHARRVRPGALLELRDPCRADSSTPCGACCRSSRWACSSRWRCRAR